MAIIKQGILGGFQNKIGSVVGTSWKGIAVMKSKPISVANPRTAGQVAQRTKLTVLTQFLSPILASVIKPFNDRFAVKQSGFNVVTSRNLPFVADNGDIAFASIQLSAGKLSVTDFSLNQVSGGNNSFSAEWESGNLNQYDLATDELTIAVYNETTGIWIFNEVVGARSVGASTDFFTGEVTAGDQLRAYAQFRRTDGTYVSNSAYTAEIAGA